MCKECLPSLGVQRFENYMGSNSGLCAGCLSTSDGMTFSWFWTLDHILTGIVMQQDYAVIESTHRVKDQLNSMWWEVLWHCAYKQELLPWDFQIFGLLKEALRFQVTVWRRLRYSSLGSSPKNSLQLGYTDMY